MFSHCLDKTYITEESNVAFYKANVETSKYKKFIVECVESYSGICTYPIATAFLRIWTMVISVVSFAYSQVAIWNGIQKGRE